MMYVYKRTESLTYQESEVFRSDLCRQLHIHQKEGHLCDVQLHAHGRTVPAHRAVLAVRSQYFNTMFTGEFQERWQSTIDLSNSVASAETLETLMTYMYSGEMTITSQSLEDILSAGSLLMMDSVKQHCAQYMVTNLSPINCVHMWALAEVYGLTEVSLVCTTMAKSRFRDFMQHRKEILDTPGLFLQKMVKEKIFSFMKPKEILMFLLRWMEFSPNERACECVALLKVLRDRNLIEDKVLDLEASLLVKEDDDSHVGPTAEQVKDLIVKGLDILSPVTPDFSGRRYKALVSWLIATTFEDNTQEGSSRMETICRQTCQVHFYLPNQDEWYVKNITLPDDKRLKSFIGSISSLLVFQLEYDEVLLCDCSKSPLQWRVAPNKVEIKVVAELDYHFDQFVIFDGKLFYVVMSLYRTLTSSARSKNRMEVFYLDIIDGEKNSWTQCASVELNYHLGGMPTPSFYFVQTTVCEGSLYILAWCAGCKWLKISNCDGNYKRTDLNVPNESWMFMGKCWIRISGPVITVEAEQYRHMLLFDTITREWCEVHRDIESSPPSTPLPLRRKPLMVLSIPVDLDMVQPITRDCPSVHSPVQVASLCVQVLGPYLCKFWQCCGNPSDKNSFSWAERSPPSTEKLREFWVAEVSQEIVESCEKLIYPDRSEERGQSPMAHLRLPGHMGHTDSAHPIHSSCHFTDARFDPYYEDAFSFSEDSGSGDDRDAESSFSSDEEESFL